MSAHSQRFPRAVALRVAKAICSELVGSCEAFPGNGAPAIKVCGSLRRGRHEVGDVEIVYIPRMETVPTLPDLLGDTTDSVERNMVDMALDRLLTAGILAKRVNKLGRTTWGECNKLAVHCESGVPIDFFATYFPAWHGYIVCRTGSAESNTRIATAAIRQGWRWHPTAGHFTDVMGRRHWIHTEEDAFRLVGLPYLDPKDR